MLQSFDGHFIKHDRWFFVEKIDLLLDSRIHCQRTNFTEHGHALVFLNITGWYGMHKHFCTNVFNTRLEAWPSYSLDLHEFLALLV